MAAKTRDKITADGLRFQKMLKELSELEVRIGFQAGKAMEDDGTDVCDVAAWNELGTVNMPARPFIRDSVDDHESEINNFLKGMKKEIVNGKSAEEVLKKIGVFQKDLMQEQIRSGSYAPNAPSTIAKKGSSHPLIDTGRMRQSVDYVIKKKGGGD